MPITPQPRPAEPSRAMVELADVMQHLLQKHFPGANVHDFQAQPDYPEQLKLNERQVAGIRFITEAGRENAIAFFNDDRGGLDPQTESARQALLTDMMALFDGRDASAVVQAGDPIPVSGVGTNQHPGETCGSMALRGKPEELLAAMRRNVDANPALKTLLPNNGVSMCG